MSRATASRIVIGGKNNIAVEVCQYILSHYPNSLSGIIPNRNDPGKDGWQPSFKNYARNNSLPVLSLEEIYSWGNLLFISLEFDRIINPSKFASQRLFNIHFSLLPKYKGCHTSILPILNGETESGVTLHCIDRGIDCGQIIAQKSFRIKGTETGSSLYEKYLKYGQSLVFANLDRLIHKSYRSTPQKIRYSTYYPRNFFNYAELLIDLNQTADMIDRQIRAFHFRAYQMPQVYGRDISFTRFTNKRSSEPPGTLLCETEFTFTIATIDYDLILFKDCFPKILRYIEEDNLDQLKRIPYIQRYASEKDPETGMLLYNYAQTKGRDLIAQYLYGSTL